MTDFYMWRMFDKRNPPPQETGWILVTADKYTEMCKAKFFGDGASSTWTYQGQIIRGEVVRND